MEYILLWLWIAIVLGTIIPETGNDFWLIRGQDYFKSFYAVLHLIALPLILKFSTFSWLTWLMFFISAACFLYCLVSIILFTSLAPTTVEESKGKTNNTLSIFISNVYQYNTDYSKTLNIIRELDPDLIFLLETDSGWEKGMKPLSENYPHQIKEIKSDTYGLMLLSKIAFEQAQLLHRVKADIPSVEVLLKLDGEEIKISGLHPKPPLPGEALWATKKDRELLRTAISINSSTVKHHLLIGDLNDVAWSSVTRRFKRITGMKDPRQGRGFFPTFPSWSPIRIPLDHVFCSSGFRLVEFKLAGKTGSDHFPVFVEFELVK